MPDAPHLVDSAPALTPGAVAPAAGAVRNDGAGPEVDDARVEAARLATATAAIALLGSRDGPWRDRVARLEQWLGRLRDGRRLVRLVVPVMLVAGILVGAGAWFLLRSGVPAAEPLPFTKKRQTTGGTEPSHPIAGAGEDVAGRRSGGPGEGGAEAGGTVPAGAPASRGSGGTTVATVWADVTGAVLRPGLVPLGEGARLAEAIAAAGGLAPDADRDRINLAGRVRDGERVYVPRRGEQSAPSVVAGADESGEGKGAAPGAGGGSRGAPTAPAGPIDLNTATAEQLDTLPGIGPATAAAIIDYRTQHGPFRSVDELDQVRGLGAAKVEQLRTRVRVGP